MEGLVTDFSSWAAPILSTLVICAGQLALNSRFKRADEKRDRARAETEKKLQDEKSWRDTISERLDEQDVKIRTILGAQCTQMRSDIIHRAHRYIDDLGCASTEEKESFHAEYEDYQALCEASDVVNHFIDDLVSRTMQLPERKI